MKPVRSPEPNLRHALRYVSRLYQAEFTARLAGHGMSEAEYRAMFLLRRQPDLSNAALARTLGVSAQGANQVLQTLIAAGWVSRQVSRENARVLLSRLTAAGTDVVEACEREGADLENTMCSGLTDPERTQLEELLHRCAEGLGAPITGPTENGPQWNRAQPDVVARRVAAAPRARRGTP
ncbi:MarR family winged helix-turn-helix transcriptional regulator [Cryptosporangium sp. NPDC048952]|uniref:MarR family winged helix-turn-helix transcriptional regulator n=1 Tax=Cryptosporangium sp. NPDC048952 TaxID=3363961 RepID=UPI00371D3E11